MKVRVVGADGGCFLPVSRALKHGDVEVCKSRCDGGAALDDLDVTVDTFSVGLRYTFGGNLRARDRSGADLGGIDRMFSAF